MQRWAWNLDHVDPGSRHVAVLFADLSGFTALVESIGPEIAVELVAPVMDGLMTVVHAHAGVIQQVVGDGLMSVFGLRSQQGDEAAQAVRAGVALVRTASECGVLPVHVGLECGEVVISRSWEPAGFAVWGGAVAAAQRLCTLARPGTVWVGPRAIELAELDVTVASQRAGVDGMDGGLAANIVTADAAGASAAMRTVPPPGGRLRKGIGPRPPKGALSRAEVAVARLVAEGLSNPQIAKRLYISRHTAETHMKHIFAKLGVSSRAELAAKVASRLVASEL